LQIEVEKFKEIAKEIQEKMANESQGKYKTLEERMKTFNHDIGVLIEEFKNEYKVKVERNANSKDLETLVLRMFGRVMYKEEERLTRVTKENREMKTVIERKKKREREQRKKK
jgi:hypothetical protein